MLNVLFGALLAQVTPPPPPPVLGSPTPAPVTTASPIPAPSASALSATPATVGLRPGGSVTVTIDGATGALNATVGTPLVALKVDSVAHTITVTAAGQLGSDTLHVADETGASIDIPLRVAQDAGSIPPSLTLKVTGSPIDAAWLAQQIQTFVMRSLSVLSGAQVTLAPIVAPSPPTPGQSMQLSVPVQIGGNANYWDVSGATNVNVQNVAIEPFAPPLLFYDDDPERVNADGVLYRGTIVAGTAARLYYYHDDGDDPRRLVVALSAAASDPTSVQIIDASAGPNIDVMSVGHAVSRDFLSVKARNEGTIVDFNGDAPLVLHDLPMTSREGVAGSIGFQVLSGGPVTVTVIAVSPGVDPATMLNGALLPSDGHHRTGVFSITNFGNSSLAYSVGGPDAKIVYADREPTAPRADPGSAGHDYGDYGVTHTFLFSLDNPTSAPANLYLYERPIGGVVRSSFLVDGNLVQVGCVRQPVPYQIEAFSLQPNQRYQLTVQTMTDGGSNYPIELGVTTTPPQPTAPPISAPDGCFPKQV